MKKNLFTKAAAFIAVAALTAGTFAGCSNSGSKDNATTAAGATKAEQTADKQGNNAAADFDTSKDITVVTREEGSGTRGAFVELTGVEQKNADGKKIDMTTEEAIVQSSTQNVITAVNGDTYAIGYVSLGSLNKDVKAVKVDGVEATVDTVKSGEYKVQRPFNIATKDDVSDAAKDFISYIMSSEGQAIIEDSGYIKVDDSAAAYAATDAKGEVKISGSSSVTPVMEKLKEAYEKVNSNITITINQSDSSTGMKDAAEGISDIGMASRDLKDSELETLKNTVIAKDGIAIVVNNASPIENLTSDQIMKIYTGEITTWADVK